VRSGARPGERRAATEKLRISGEAESGKEINEERERGEGGGDNARGEKRGNTFTSAPVG